MTSHTLFHRLCWQLDSASRRQIFGTVLLLQLLLFLLDVGSGASISFAPFHALPVALGAWRLARPAIAVTVLLASVARVADFYLTRHHDGPVALSYDLLQSACFFGLVAWLTLLARQANQRLTRSVGRFRRKARAERHSRRLDATIRQAVLDDVPAIVRLTAAANERGAFDQSLASAARQTALVRNFSNGIVTGSVLRDVWGGGRAMAPVEFWVSELDGRLLGYIMVLGIDDKQGPEREMHALAVDPASRGLGVGSALLDFFCARYQHRRRVVACRTASRMAQMALRRGFRYHGSSDNFDLLVRD
jgi:ribosomal protein S18 acetylase RimI-like enzyme